MLLEAITDDREQQLTGPVPQGDAKARSSAHAGATGEPRPPSTPNRLSGSPASVPDPSAAASPCDAASLRGAASPLLVGGRRPDAQPKALQAPETHRAATGSEGTPRLAAETLDAGIACRWGQEDPATALDGAGAGALAPAADAGAPRSAVPESGAGSSGDGGDWGGHEAWAMLPPSPEAKREGPAGRGSLRDSLRGDASSAVGSVGSGSSWRAAASRPLSRRAGGADGVYILPAGAGPSVGGAVGGARLGGLLQGLRKQAAEIGRRGLRVAQHGLQQLEEVLDRTEPAVAVAAARVRAPGAAGGRETVPVASVAAADPGADSTDGGRWEVLRGGGEGCVLPDEAARLVARIAALPTGRRAEAMARLPGPLFRLVRGALADGAGAASDGEGGGGAAAAAAAPAACAGPSDEGDGFGDERLPGFCQSGNALETKAEAEAEAEVIRTEPIDVDAPSPLGAEAPFASAWLGTSALVWAGLDADEHAAGGGAFAGSAAAAAAAAAARGLVAAHLIDVDEAGDFFAGGGGCGGSGGDGGGGGGGAPGRACADPLDALQ